MKIILPFPPSTNRLWRCPTKGPLKGRHMLSACARDYKSSVALILDNAGVKPITGPVRVQVLAHPPNRRRRDIDNLLKITLDSLSGYAFEDDHQIDAIEITRGILDRPSGNIEVTVTPFFSEVDNEELS